MPTNALSQQTAVEPEGDSAVRDHGMQEDFKGLFAQDELVNEDADEDIRMSMEVASTNGKHSGTATVCSMTKTPRR